MYIEDKSRGLSGDARIGLVSFSRSGRTVYYRGRAFQSLSGAGSKANYFDVETGDHYWISGPRRDGRDRLYGERVPVAIDEDIRRACWTEVREKPELSDRPTANL